MIFIHYSKGSKTHLKTTRHSGTVSNLKNEPAIQHNSTVCDLGRFTQNPDIAHVFGTYLNVFNDENYFFFFLTIFLINWLLTNYCVSHPRVSPSTTPHNFRIIHSAPLSSTYEPHTRLTVYYYYFYTMLVIRDRYEDDTQF